VVDYILRQDDFDFSEFVEYKESMSNDYAQFGEKIIDKLEESERSKNEAEVRGSIYQALYREVANERDSAVEAIEQVSNYDFGQDDPETFSTGNVNWGNQVLSEQPPNNWNMGNQVILEEEWPENSDTDTDDSRDVMEYWDELDETGPDPIV